MTSFYYANTVCNLIAGVALLSAVLVVSVSNPVNSVLWLIVSFVSVATYLVTSGMTFIGLSYIIVYVGAIAVLFLFVVMILNITSINIGNTSPVMTSNSNTVPLAIIIVLLASYMIWPSDLNWSMPISILNAVNTPFNLIPPDISTVMTVGTGLTSVSAMSQVQVLGITMYTIGSLWLLLISVLLILSMLVPIALCLDRV